MNTFQRVPLSCNNDCNVRKKFWDSGVPEAKQEWPLELNSSSKFAPKPTVAPWSCAWSSLNDMLRQETDSPNWQHNEIIFE